MSQDERLKIFVSSTVEELKDARAIAKEAINHFQFSPLMCEDWGAATESSRKTYLKEIQNSDVYIGIFWKNYSEPTVEEYREAIRLGKEILLYVKKEENELRNNNLKEFLTNIKNLDSGHIYYEYDTVVDLKARIKDNISRIVSKKKEISKKLFDYDNLMNFCKKQIKSNMDYLKGTYEEDKHKKYILDLYVERDELEGNFKNFLDSYENCAVVVGEAGIGKTNLFCHLPEKFVNMMPVLFYDAKSFSYINKTIEDEILDDFNREFNTQLTFSELVNSIDKILNEKQTKIVIFIDAINECLRPDALKVDLAKIVQKNKKIKFFISCRDIDWNFFSNNNDELLQNLFCHKNPKPPPRERVLWFNKFTEKEFINSWKKYKEVYNLDGELTEEVKNICMHPIMLRFLAEAYEGEQLPKDIRRKQIFDKYWERKLLQTGRRFKAEEQIFKIISALKERNVTELPETEVYRILGETTDEQNSTVTKILSEDLITFRDKENIILQLRLDKVGERVIGFTYEAFFEYVLARYILYTEWKYKNGAEKLEAFDYLVKNIDKFKSLKGASAFLILLEESTKNNIQFEMIEILNNSKIFSIRNIVDLILKFENEINIKDALFLLWNKDEYLNYRIAVALSQIIFNNKSENLKWDIFQRISTDDNDCSRDVFLTTLLCNGHFNSKENALMLLENLTQFSNNYTNDMPLHAYRLLAKSDPNIVPLNILEKYTKKDDMYTMELIKQVLQELIESKRHLNMDMIGILMKKSMIGESVENYNNFNTAINKICASMHLQRSVKEYALSVCLNIEKNDSLNKNKYKEIIAVSVYIACQIFCLPRNINEIAELIGVDNKKVNKLFKIFMDKLQLQERVISSNKWAQYFCVQLNLYGENLDKSILILTQFGEKTAINRKGYAAAAVYIASILCGDRRTQKEIGSVARISTPTISKYYKELAEVVDIEIIL